MLSRHAAGPIVLLGLGPLLEEEEKSRKRKQTKTMKLLRKFSPSM